MRLLIESAIVIYHYELMSISRFIPEQIGIVLKSSNDYLLFGKIQSLKKTQKARISHLITEDTLLLKNEKIYMSSYIDKGFFIYGKNFIICETISYVKENEEDRKTLHIYKNAEKFRGFSID